MSADAALIILEQHTDSQICQALQNRPQVRVRLQRILRWGPPPTQQPQRSTHQHSNTSAQQAPWPDGDRPAFSDPTQSQAQFGGAPPQQAQTQQQAQQAPQHWGQQSGDGQSRNWHDMTEQEHRPRDAGTHMPAQSPQDTWGNWGNTPSTGGKGKGTAPAGHAPPHTSPASEPRQRFVATAEQRQGLMGPIRQQPRLDGIQRTARTAAAASNAGNRTLLRHQLAT